MSAELYATAALPQRPGYLPGRAPSEPDVEPRRRLRVLERPAPARRPRLVYGLVAVAGALAIGAAQMGLSILTTQSSYEIKALTSQQRELSWQQQILADDVAGLSSPQYLAANAASLGMVTGQTPTYLRLSDATIIGQGKAASGTSSVSALAKAAVDNALVARTPLVTNPSTSLSGGIVATAPVAEAGAEGDSTADDATTSTAPTTESATPPAITDGLPTPDTH